MVANPFVADGESDPTANLPDAGTFGKIQDQWNAFLDKPGGRAALLSFGINLLQPPSFGDNPLAQVGRAIGAAGETGGRIEAMDVKQQEEALKAQEAASKEELRTANTQLAGAHAAHYGTMAQLAQERNANLIERNAQALTLGKLAASNQLYGKYNTYRQDAERENLKRSQDFINKPPQVPVLSFEEFLGSDAGARDIAERAGIGVTPKAPAAKPTASGADAQALEWLKNNPNDPNAAGVRARLQSKGLL